MQSSSPGTTCETWAQTGAARTGVQPGGDWSNGRGDMRGRPRCGTRGYCSLFDPVVGFGRSAQRDLFERFNITNSVPDLSAKLEKYRSARFGSPALTRRFTDLPALGQLGLGHASSVHVLHPCAGVVRTPMKALERQEVKVGDFSLECRA
jgi:hypothetical protein